MHLVILQMGLVTALLVGLGQTATSLVQLVAMGMTVRRVALAWKELYVIQLMVVVLVCLIGSAPTALSLKSLPLIRRQSHWKVTL